MGDFGEESHDILWGTGGGGGRGEINCPEMNIEE